MFNIPKQPTMPIRSHRDLIVWQEAMELVRECYHLAERLPAMEKFGIATQIRRSAVSVPANIAEGHGRRGRAEFLHHLSIAEGSLRELQTLLEAALATRLLERDQLNDALGRSNRVGFLLTRLQQRLRAPRAPSTAVDRPRLP